MFPFLVFFTKQQITYFHCATPLYLLLETCRGNGDHENLYKPQDFHGDKS